MPDILIRGIPPETHDLIRQYAKEDGLSVNDYLIRLIERIAKRFEEEEEIRARRAQADQRLKMIRANLCKKHHLDKTDRANE